MGLLNMKENFKEQFQNLKKIIINNINTLRDLVKQSDQLSNVIKTLEDKTENELLKKQLENLKCEISKSIDALIEQTNQLFKTYEKLVEEIFGKQ